MHLHRSVRSHVILLVHRRREIVQVDDVLRDRELRAELFHEELLGRDFLAGKAELTARDPLPDLHAAVSLQFPVHSAWRVLLPEIGKLRRAQRQLHVRRLFGGARLRRAGRGQLIISPNDERVFLPLQRNRLERDLGAVAPNHRPHAVDDILVVAHVAQLRLDRRGQIFVERLLCRAGRGQFLRRGNLRAQVFHRGFVVANQVALRRQFEARNRLVGLDRALGLQAPGHGRRQKRRQLLQVRRVHRQLEIARRAPKTFRRFRQLHRAAQLHMIRSPIDPRFPHRRRAFFGHDIQPHVIEHDAALLHVIELGRDRPRPGLRRVEGAFPVHRKIFHLAAERARRPSEIFAQLA